MTERAIHFISDLVTYKPKSIIIRTLIVSLIALLCLLMTDRITAINLIETKKTNIMFFIGVIFITEINILLNYLITKLGNDTVKYYRISLQIIMNVILILLVLSTAMPTFKSHDEGSLITHLLVFFTSVFVVFLMLAISLVRTVQIMYESQCENERLSRAKIESDYQTLVEQVNPHFLFNNLSVLKSLIMYDKDKALQYVQNFTDIYRYVLQIKSRDLVHFSEELEFVKSYIALHQERLGDGLAVKYDIHNDALSKMILPVGLQILVENALKHNIATKSQPLMIEIIADAATVTVKNSLNKKEVVFSTRKGLGNLVVRYKILTERKISVKQTETEFIVSLPLI